MNTKKYTGIILAGIMVVSVFAAGMPAMVSAADPVGTGATFENQTRYGPSPSAHVATGGNITNVTISATTLTGKWQGYFGTIDAKITLRDDEEETMINWTVTDISGKEVIATTNTTANWSKTLSGATAAEVDTVWVFGTDADNATNTLDDGTMTADIAGNASITGCAVGKTYNGTGIEVWNTTVVRGLNDSANSEDDFLFAGIIITTGEAYNGDTVDFQMIVPTTEGATETYYFYVEL